MSDPPPSVKRPDWNADTMVLPDENESGSTCVACWLVVLVKGSELILVSGTLARTGDAPMATAPTAAATPRQARAQRAPGNDSTMRRPP